MTRPDRALVAASRDGDHEAYAELTRRHLRRVFAVCLGVLGELDDAEDAAQDAFVKGFERIRSLRDGRRFPAWITQIARNRCRDLLRRRKRRPESPLTDLVEDTTAVPPDRYADLRRALARLTENDRLPLLLYYFDGKNTRTVAAELGLSQGGACSRLYRARRRLRGLLEDEEVTRHA